MRFLKISCVSGVLFSLLMAGCGGRGKPIARVNGEKIDRETFYRRLELLAGRQALTELINEDLQMQLAAKEGVTPTDKEVEEKIKDLEALNPDLIKRFKDQGLTMEDLKEKVKVDLAGFKIATKGITVSDQEVQDYYNKNKDTQFTRPERVHLRRIVVTNPKDAEQVKEMLKQKIDFTTIAQTKSADPQTRQTGGDMGYIFKNDPRVPPQILKLAFTLKQGEFTQEPIVLKGMRDSSGRLIVDPTTRKPAIFYTFIKVEEHAPREVLPFEKVKRTVWENLMARKARREEWQKKVQEFQIAADIKVFPERFRSLEKQPCQGSPVIAPLPEGVQPGESQAPPTSP